MTKERTNKALTSTVNRRNTVNNEHEGENVLDYNDDDGKQHLEESFNLDQLKIIFLTYLSLEFISLMILFLEFGYYVTMSLKIKTISINKIIKQSI